MGIDNDPNKSQNTSTREPTRLIKIAPPSPNPLKCFAYPANSKNKANPIPNITAPKMHG